MKYGVSLGGVESDRCIPRATEAHERPNRDTPLGSLTCSRPASTIAKTEELRATIGPEKYEALVIEAIQNGNSNSLPCNATEFLEILNASLQNSAKAISSDSDRIRLVRS